MGGSTPHCARAAAPRRARGSARTSRESPRDDGADLHLVAVLDDLAVREEEVAADHHRRPGQDAEVGEELRNPPAPGDLDRTAVGSQVDAHQKKVPVAPRRNTLKAAALP